MSKVLLCSVLLLSIGCSSSGSNSGNAGASSANGGAGPSNGGAGGAASVAGGNATGGGDQAGTAGDTATAGGSGTAGSSTNAGAAGAAGGSAQADTSSVTQRGADSARTSHWIQSSLSKANVMTKMALDADFKANFDGEFTSSPLFLAGATPGSGRFYAATTQNDVYALDELTGAVVWKHNIGAFLQTAPVCGNDPQNHGIVSTPVIDAAAHKIFVAAAMADGHHEIHALSTDTGMEITPGWPIDVSKIKAGELTFEYGVQNQRSALSLVDGVLYVAFGGYCGDAGNYHGWVVGVNSADPSKVGAWATIERQAGIWAAGGLASDGNGVFAITGNSGVQADRTMTDSEEIIRVTGLGTGNRDSKNLFYPTEWAQPMNAKDLDFGSCSPAVVNVPDAKPSTIVVAPAKPGRVYFLDASNLGGSLGQFADMAVADTNGQSVYTTPSAYQAASGVHVAIATGSGSQCPNAMTLGAAVMSILLKPSAAGQVPMPSIAWCAPLDSGDVAKRAPISTNSAGIADPIVWYLNGSKLNAFDGDTGATLYDSSKGATPSSCAGVHKFTTLIAVNGRIVVGGDSAGKAHLCSWSVH